MSTKVTEEQILDVITTITGRKNQAEVLGISIRGLTARISRMVEAGKLNWDQSLPIYPGAGRQITSVTTFTDSEGNPKSFHIKEKQISGEHIPVIDAPIIRQSRLTGRSGEVLAQWDIRVPNKIQEAQRALVDGFIKELVPLPPRVVMEFNRNTNLANEYVFTDSHIGAMIDLETEEQLQDQQDLIMRCFENMIMSAPKTDTGIVVILGDWFHFDNLLPITPRSGNVLFSNGNYRDLVECGVKIMRKILDLSLIVHEKVEIVICEGNHDQASAMWLKLMMMALYENETRIKIADSESPFYAIPFGQSFLGYHHGHIKGLKDSKDLALFFATEFRKMWGDTKYTYLKTGHLHHVHEKEEHGIFIQQMPTLAGKDHHAQTHGYRSNEAAVCTTFSKEYGEVGTTRITKDMLR